MVHIKRDGGWICGGDSRKWYSRYDSHITFTEAHRMDDLKHVCRDCVKEYHRRLERIPVVVVDYKKPSKKKKADIRTIEISDQPAKTMRRES